MTDDEPDALTLFDRHGQPRRHAVARRTDRSTSWEAARSLGDLRRTQQVVLLALTRCGPATDEELYDALPEPMSPSGCRTRRSELESVGLVEACGYGTSASGRRATRWQVTDRGRALTRGTA